MNNGSFQSLPAALCERSQWVCWSFAERDGKRTKVPRRADNPSRLASTTDPTTWSTFEHALETAEFSENVDGIGYVFAADDPFAGVDLDAGISDDDRSAIISHLHSYTERSVSGRGVHVIVRATLNGERNRAGSFEVYEQGRYFVVTGQHVEGTPLEITERQSELEEVLESFLPARPPVAPQGRAPLPVAVQDEDLLERMFAAKNGRAIRDLWSGSLAGYESQSEADAALCAHLAFWTGRDPGRIDALFRRSALMRDKWDSKRGESSYGADTIAHAMMLVGEGYQTGNGSVPRGNGAIPVIDIQPETEEPAPLIEPFVGLTHADALAADLTVLAGGQFVEELVERGTVGTVAGIPETYKTWLAQEIAVAIAQGDGEILGCKVLEQANVGYFWQDDSQRNELERIQTFARLRDTPPDLPLRWFLNEGLKLPEDLQRLRATIEHYKLEVAWLDSFYNVAGGLDLKDRDAGALVAALKSEVSDPTGCTVGIVDHAPWPTDSNRGQMRAYGDVHKGAAIRWGIYIQRDRNKIYIEARGNNIRGIPRRPALWDPDTLQLKLLDDVAAVSPDEYDERLLTYLQEHPWANSRECDTGPEGRASDLRQARQRLQQQGRIRAGKAADAGKTGSGKYWTANPPEKGLFVA